MVMPHIDYPRFIEEGEEELRKLEKRHRYSHLFHRVRMLGLLKSEEYSTIEEAAKSLGYSRRQAQRWFAAYKEGGMKEMLTSRVEELGRGELITEEAAKRGEIATIAQAHEFLAERGIGYSHPESAGGLLRRRKVKLKTGRPRHEKADPKEQEEFKKVPREDSRGEARGEVRGERRRAGAGRRAGDERPVKVLAFDEARFGLINWNHRRYCPKGFRPPRVVWRRYEWSYLYADVEPATGESFCSYIPGMDGRCFETFLRHLGEAYADHHLVLVLDNAPSHLSQQIAHPET